MSSPCSGWCSVPGCGAVAPASTSAATSGPPVRLVGFAAGCARGDCGGDGWVTAGMGRSVSLHYELVLSLWLRPDTPAEYVDELRYHLGMTDESPGALELADRVFAGGGDDYLTGGIIATLKLAQPFANRPAAWGLHVRTFVLDDSMYELLTVVPPWLARWSATQGWIGFAREEMSLDIWLNFDAANGHAYLAGPGEQPVPATDDAQQFPERKQTTVDV